jgi:hypothetical protein
MRVRTLVGVAVLLVAAAGVGGGTATASRFSVGYSSERALSAALARAHGTVVRRIPALHIAEVRPQGAPRRFAAAIACLPGIRSVEPVAARVDRAEPGLTARLANGLPLEWAYAATHADAVPPAILRAAGSLTIAVVDTGADLTAPDLAAKAPTGFSLHAGTVDVRDPNGHGTFVASLAAGSVSNGEGIAGFGGDARLLIVKAGAGDGSFSDVDEAIGIVYAVDHGARIVNLSLGGPTSSATERNAVAYAAAHGVLLVAAAGNNARSGNPLEYPAALLSDGAGLAVGASNVLGGRASFSSFGSYLSLVAPGVNVLGALPSAGSVTGFQAVRLPGSRRGRYGLGSGTSFAAPQVAGAAALVWAANPSLSAGDVATILEQSASGDGAWTPELGYGVLDVAAAVARASGRPLVEVDGARVGDTVRLTWRGHGVSTFRVAVSEDGGPSRVLVNETTATEASFPLAGKRTYAFTVTGLAPGGAPAASSAPFRVATVRSNASIVLAASRTGPGGTRTVVLTASLRAAVPSVSLAARQLVLEARNGTSWRVVGRARTDLTGQAHWALRLAPGGTSLRVLFPGAHDLAAAVAGTRR